MNVINVNYDNINLALELQKKGSNVENPIKENNIFIKGETDINVLYNNSNLEI